MTIRLHYIIFALAALTGVAVRSAMLIFTIDPASGFFRAEYTYSAIGFIIFLTCAGLAVFVSALLLPTTTRKAVTIDGIPFCAAAVLMAAAIVYETFFSSILSTVPIFQQTLHYAVSAAAVASLLYISFCKFLKKEFPPIISLAPILFWGMRLIVVFTGFSTISAISDTVIETIGMCLALSTFLFYAKVETMQRSSFQRLYFAVAMLCSFVSALGSFPRLIADIFAAEEAIHMTTIPYCTAFATGIFSFIFAMELFKKIRKQ